MDQDMVRVIIQKAIQSADVDYPEIEPGVQRNRVFRSNEESSHLARAVVEALKRNGLTVESAPEA